MTMDLSDLWGHSASNVGRRKTQPLALHLLHTARLAEIFATPFGAGELACQAGLRHDLGKASEQFQAYVRGNAARGGNHLSLGASLASQNHCPELAFVIAGHHGGLPNPEDLKQTLSQPSPGAEACGPLLDHLKDLGLHDALSSPTTASSLDREMLIRFLFSCLVDADWLDTDAHFKGHKHFRRLHHRDLEALAETMIAAQDELIARSAPSPVNEIRRQVHEQCVAASRWDPGFFTLAAPTGAGKTRAAMAFALEHARLFDKDRVIVVIPYTSIIEQTAEVYRDILGADAVLEHHGSVDWDAIKDDQLRQQYQLAAENWDSPIVVTTSVQFFESLFDNRPGKCRKLHNVANSVIIIDETQTLPYGLLGPTMDGLRSLVENYRVSVLMTTATHLDYHDVMPAGGTEDFREIIPDPKSLYQALSRVDYEFGEGRVPNWSWDELTRFVAGEEQVLVVLNTRADAANLFGRVSPLAGAIHLSSNMCSTHRHEVLAEVRRRLQEGEPCRLISTQVVEAGVDVDFPVAVRAIGPLDRIVQTAGRCNREGKRERGRLIVVVPEGQIRVPPGQYEQATFVTLGMLRAANPPNLDDPEIHRSYFREIGHYLSTDDHGIQELRERFRFEEVAETYQMIEDSTSVIVDWGRSRQIAGEIREKGDVSQEDMRSLQPFVVNLRPKELEKAVAASLCEEVITGSNLWMWRGRYDAHTGLQAKGEG